jgi:putative copper resistance protein D
MFDEFYLQLIWESGVGDASLLRAILLLIALIATVIGYQLSHSKVFVTCLNIVLMLSVIGLAYSFTLFGHTAELVWSIKLVLMLHVVAMAWWMGSLWPLYHACDRLKADELYRLMHRFGQYASVIVSLLILAGFILFYAISEFSIEVLLQPYGMTFLIKLLFVGALLLLAARHKLSLVPQLKGNDQSDFYKSKNKLRRSIGVEMVIAAFVLVITSVFTTLVSPLH